MASTIFKVDLVVPYFLYLLKVLFKRELVFLSFPFHSNVLSQSNHYNYDDHKFDFLFDLLLFRNSKFGYIYNFLKNYFTP